MALGYGNECLAVYLNSQEVHGSYSSLSGNNLIWFYYMLLHSSPNRDLLLQEVMSPA